MVDNSIDDLMNSEAWKAYEKKMLEKEKFLKKGPNVIHLEYLASLFSEDDFREYEERLGTVGLELSRFDKSGVMYACLDEFKLVTFFVLSQPIMVELIKGTGSNATWDVIKFLLISAWKRVQNKFYNRATSQYLERKEISFGLKVSLDKNTSFNISLNGDLDESVIQNSLDKILNFLGEQKLNEKYKHPEFVYFNTDTDKWEKVDVDEKIRKMIKNGKLNKK